MVTQIRVSDDYQPGNTQWRIGDTTILAHAVGLAAFKDVSSIANSIMHVSCVYIGTTNLVEAGKDRKTGRSILTF